MTESDADGDAALAWETLTSEVAYRCPGFDVVHEEVALPGGYRTDFDFVDEPPTAVVLPLTPAGDVVLVEEWRQAVDRVNRGLPAGTLRDGEDRAGAARRELREETGYEADGVAHLTTVEPLNGVADAVHHYFLARGCRPTGETDHDPDETIRVTTTPFDALRRRVLAGEVRDGRTVLGVCYHLLAGGAGSRAPD